MAQCRATSKRTGVRCRGQAIPFGDVCRFHGGYSPGSLLKARAAFEKYVRYPDVYEPTWLRNQNIRNYMRFQERQAARLMRKNGLAPSNPKRRRRTPTSDAPAIALPAESYGFEFEI